MEHLLASIRSIGDATRPFWALGSTMAKASARETGAIEDSLSRVVIETIVSVNVVGVVSGRLSLSIVVSGRATTLSRPGRSDVQGFECLL